MGLLRLNKLLFASVSCLTLFPILAGCAWRTERADHIFGPSFFRVGRTAPGRADVVQTLHVPLLLEGGRQWGLSVGAIRREAVVPRRANPAELAPIELGQPQGIFIREEPAKWHASWIYFRAPLRETPLFIRRSVVGLHGSVGAELRSVSLGYSSVTATMPREDALHELDFNSRRPLEATAVVTPLAELERLQQNENSALKKEHHE